MKEIEIIKSESYGFEYVNDEVDLAVPPKCDSWNDCRPYCYWPYSIYSAGLALHFESS